MDMKCAFFTHLRHFIIPKCLIISIMLHFLVSFVHNRHLYFMFFSGITRPTLYKLHILTFQNISTCSMSSVIKKKMLAYKCDVFFVAYVTVTPSIIDINFVMFQ